MSADDIKKIVTGHWLDAQMKKHKLTGTNLSIAVGCGKADISNYRNEVRPISKIRAVAFYYYFKDLERS